MDPIEKVIRDKIRGEAKKLADKQYIEKLYSTEYGGGHSHAWAEQNAFVAGVIALRDAISDGARVDELEAAIGSIADQCDPVTLAGQLKALLPIPKTTVKVVPKPSTKRKKR